LQNAANLESGEERAEIDRGRSGSLFLSLSLDRSIDRSQSLSLFNRCEWHETKGKKRKVKKKRRRRMGFGSFGWKTRLALPY